MGSWTSVSPWALACTCVVVFPLFAVSSWQSVCFAFWLPGYLLAIHLDLGSELSSQPLQPLPLKCGFCFVPGFGPSCTS